MEEQSIVNRAQKEYPPKNPFQKESDESASDRSIVGNSLSSRNGNRQCTEGPLNTRLPSSTTKIGAEEISSNPFETRVTSNLENTTDTRTTSAVNPLGQPSVQTASNPFKQAALDERKSRSDGVNQSTGLVDEQTYAKVTQTLNSSFDAEQRVKETADTVLQSTVGSQHRMLKSFTNAKSSQQNPFRAFSPAAQPPSTATATSHTTVKNPFASFSASPPTSAPVDKQSSSHLTTTAKTSTMNAPSYSVFASGKSFQPPSASAPNANPFLRGFPFGNAQQPPLTQRSGASCDTATSNDTSQKSKLTCPQCGMAFRLQRALDAHISTSHTIASSLYTDPSFTESNDINPFQPAGARPTIPADPFTD
uniref:C2H2-type domain-containing protein n=1 Tax=Paramoeba aestuarina TaxID=180227 RepID=A0A7S4NV58_9EUKA